MKSKLSRIITAIIVSVLGLSLLSLTPAVYADGDPCASGVPEAVRNAAGCDGHGDALPGVITSILYSIIAVSGIIAVIFIIVGGVNYMSSSGDSGKTEKAKKTILYAVIGLAICALSFAIVNFTINHILDYEQSAGQSENENANSDNHETDND